MGSETVILELYIIRHAQSAGNTEPSPGGKRDYPPDDPPLTARGLIEAALVADRMAHGRLDAVISSPLERAVNTAHEIAKRQSSLHVEILPDLMETDTAPGVTGCTAEILRAKYPLSLPCLDEPTPAGGTLAAVQEDFDAVSARAARCVNYVCSRFHSGERVALVTHGGFFGYILRCALGMPREELFRWSVNNSSVTKIKFYSDGTRKLSYSNDTSHLYSESPDMTYTI